MKLIIFDCDGTLVDSQHIIVAAMNQAMADNALPVLEAPHVLSIVGLSLPLAVERLIPHVDAGTVARVTQGYRDAFGTLRRDPAHHEPLYPGIAELITAISGMPDVVLGIATGKSIRGVDALLARTGMQDHFVTIQTADTHPSKPHPSMIEKALAETGVGADDAIMIGDTTYDIEMARNARVASIGVSWGYHPTSSLAEAGAHAVADDAAGLHALIGQHLGITILGRDPSSAPGEEGHP